MKDEDFGGGIMFDTHGKIPSRRRSALIDWLIDS